MHNKSVSFRELNSRKKNGSAPPEKGIVPLSESKMLVAVAAPRRTPP